MATQSIVWNMGTESEPHTFELTSALEIAVAEIVAEHAYDDVGVRTFLKDLAYGGCVSGMVGSLIYYSDTCAFYETHKSEISALLVDTLSDIGADGPTSLFRKDAWDREDPLALSEQNQNLLAWFAFEQIASQLASQAGIEL